MKLLTGLFLLTLSALSVSGSPTRSLSVRKRANNLPLIPGDSDVESLNLLKKYKKWRLEPVEVKQIEAFPKPEEKHETAAASMKKRLHENGAQTFSKVQSSLSSYSNVNGNVDTNSEQLKKVKENGHLLEAFHRQGAEQKHRGQPHHSQNLVEYNLPREQVHERVMERDGEVYQLPVEHHAKRTETEADEMLMRVTNELAAYIQDTGDEAGVMEYVAQMVKDGKISEGEGLMYMEIIKMIPGMIYNNRLGEPDREYREDKEREALAQKILSLSDYLDEEYEAGTISRTVYRELKDKLMESVLEKAEADPRFLSAPDPMPAF